VILVLLVEARFNPTCPQSTVAAPWRWPAHLEESFWVLYRLLCASLYRWCPAQGPRGPPESPCCVPSHYHKPEGSHLARTVTQSCASRAVLRVVARVGTRPHAVRTRGARGHSRVLCLARPAAESSLRTPKGCGGGLRRSACRAQRVPGARRTALLRRWPCVAGRTGVRPHAWRGRADGARSPGRAWERARGVVRARGAAARAA